MNVCIHYGNAAVATMIEPSGLNFLSSSLEPPGRFTRAFAAVAVRTLA